MPRNTNPDHQARLEALALALADGVKVKDWATSNDIKVNTAYGWSRLPGVRAKARQIQAERMAGAVALGIKYATRAMAVMIQIAEDAGAPRMERLAAAKAVHRNTIDLEAHATLAAEIGELKALVIRGKGKGKDGRHP